MLTWTKYLLFQVPEWAFLGLMLFWLWGWFALPLWVCLGLFGVWVAKDLAIYPFLRAAYNADIKTGPEKLIGARGIAQERLDPCGYAKVSGELWRVRVESGHGPILPGSLIRVRESQGLTLLVVLDPEKQEKQE